MTPQSAYSRVYTDFNGLANLKAQARAESPEAIKQVAKEFEASFVEMMMKSLRDASESEGGLMDNQATRMYQDMFDKQIAVDISERGELGIAKVIEQQLTKSQSSEMPAVQTGVSGFGPSHQLTNAQIARLAKHSRPANAHDPFNTHGLITKQTPFDLKENLKEQAVEPLVNVNQRLGSIYEMVQQEARQAKSQVNDVTINLRNPAVANRTKFNSPEEFIETLRPHAQKAAKELGVNPDLLIAQAALETGWGKKVIKHANGESSFNLFGIKANAAWDGDKVRVSSLEYRNGKAQREVSPFRSYDSFAESFEDYVQFIKQQPRYAEAIEKAGNSRSYIRELQQAGYATDPNYARKVINIMERKSLQSAWRA